MSAIKALIWFIAFEFLILLFVFIITGTFSTDGQPLQVVADVASSIGSTVWSIGIGFFIIGTFTNLVITFISIARGGGI